MKTLGYYNGTFDELEKMSVPMLDRAGYFGDGVYDVTYARHYNIYALNEHIDRFFSSAELLKIKPCISKAALAELVQELVKRLDSPNQWIYFQLSRGTGFRSHAFLEDTPSNLWIMLKPADIRDTYQPMRCITRVDTRFYHCNIKTLNLIPNILATQATVEAGVDECILHRDGIVTECAHSNLSILANGKLITHPADEFILAGTGRAHLISACIQHNIPVEERTYTIDDLMQADEIIVTSASALCMQVIEIDGKSVGGRSPETLKTLQDFLLDDFLRKTE